MALRPRDFLTKGLDVNKLATHCRENSSELRHPGHGFELFRRAIVGGDEEAWAAIYTQYHALVRVWLMGVADNDDLVQETFTRFSQAVTVERFTAGEFPTLEKLLAYMRQTAINLRHNENRRTERERRALDAWLEQHPIAVSSQNPVDDIRHELAEYVRNLVEDDQEQLVLRLTFEFELPPREIVHRYPQAFRDVDEVYRVKERLKKRLQRDPRLRGYLDR